MPKIEIDYSNTIFYKIYCITPEITDMYIGHTTNFVQRKHAHKQSCINTKCKNYNCKLYNYIREHGGWKNWIMEIIAFRNCEDHYTARKCEQEYFKEYKATLNSIEPLPTPKIKKENTEKIKKENLHCNTCNIYFTTTALQELHNNTNKHMSRLKVDYRMTTFQTPKTASKYVCEQCNFKCSKQSDYDRHTLTAKHQMLQNTTSIVQKNAKQFKCDCGKEYKHHSSLWNHKKKCTYNAEEPIENTFVQEEDPRENKLMMTIIKQMAELTKQNGELTKQITEIIPRIGDTNNSNNTNTNCNNTFNVQLYLNNECKNAMSIQDFIKSIELNMSHLKAVTEKGYVDSVSNILIKALGELEITNRPLHCTDLKRDIIYIKDNAEWNKSSAKEDKLMSGAITNIENKHYGLVKQYARETPQASVMDTPENMYQNKALQNALGNSVDSEVLQKKIYKEVLPKVKLDKSCI